MKFNYLIVGAGISGCVFAERIAHILKKSVLLVEVRNHIGGNCYEFYNEHRILIHAYGTHWFHTNITKVF
jgi:UDP-galactopyranose mutase